MLLMRFLRENKTKKSRSATARDAELTDGNYGSIENKRRLPYACELIRIARALEWSGDPLELLKEIDDAEH